MKPPAVPPVIRNGMALAGWIFMAVWLGLLLVFTVLFLMQGGFGLFGQPVETGIILLFWLVGLGGAFKVFSAPLISARREGGDLVVTKRWLLRRADHRIALGDLAPPVLVTGKDSDGDDYFRLVLTLPDGQTITLHEGHHEATAQARRAEFLTLIA